MIAYLDSADGIRADQLQGFFVGWPQPPDPQTHLRLLHASAAVVLAVDAATAQVVGFITAITDGILAAYIPLLEVLPEYRGRGIGGALVRRMLARLDGCYMIDLTCDPALQPFYERQGLHRAVGMLLRHYDRQSGRPEAQATSLRER